MSSKFEATSDQTDVIPNVIYVSQVQRIKKQKKLILLNKNNYFFIFFDIPNYDILLF